MNVKNWMGGLMRKSLVVVVFLTLGISEARCGLYEGWNYHAPVTFTGYRQSEVLTNFPALVAISNNCFGGSYAFSYGQLQSGSNDLAFTDSTGLTNLNYEIDTWNPNGTSYVWVQVPELTSNATVIAWWGAGGQGTPACTTNGSVWSNGYAAVWHMGETNAVDWSANRRNGVSYGNTTTVGCIGGAQGFNGSSSYLDSPVNLAGYGVTTNFTVSCWFRSNGGSSQTLMEDGNDYSSDAIYLFCNPDGNQMLALVRGVGGFKNNDGISVPTMGAGWHYVVQKYNGVNVEVLYDGMSVWKTAAALGAINAGNQHLHFGHRYSGNYLSGAMDEVRVANVTQSSNWIWAVYQNMASNSVFQSYGTVAAAVAGLPEVQNIAATNVTQTSACLNGLLVTNGTSSASVTLYWGPTDGTNNASVWANAVSFGANTQPTPMSYTTNLTGLTSGMTHFYRYYAVNDSGSVWASPSCSFTTMGVPVVNNAGGATGISSSLATLNGTVSGVPAPSVYVCWGTADGGAATTGAWQHVVSLGVQSGAFSTSLSGLMPNTAYYYRCYATNSEGAVWASASVPFTTDAWTLNGITLSDGNWTLIVSAASGNYTVSGYTSGAGDLDLRNTGLNITAIGASAFQSKSSITNVFLPNTVVSIGDQAFRGMSDLTNVVLSANLVSLGGWAFFGDSKLVSVTPFLPDSVTTVGKAAFYGCSALTGALRICNPAVGVSLPADGTTYATFQATAITSANLSSVTNIDVGTFRQTALTNVVLSSALQNIGADAFYSCTQLVTVTPLLPDTLVSLGNEAFWYCTALTNDLVLGLGKRPVFLGTTTFASTKIPSATLGVMVTNVPSSTFASCTSLRRVYFGGYPTLGTSSFPDVPAYWIRCYIPKNNASWETFAATGVTSLTVGETTAFQTAYPNEKLPWGTWVPSGAGTKQWYCTWTAPQDRHNVSVICVR